MAYRLGKNRPVLDDRTLRFATYVKPALPSPPAAVSYGAKVTEANGLNPAGFDKAALLTDLKEISG